ncbi:hypothetical protein VTN00DRAFT_6012 [Thermoascus crustaceus]|uniref:uncharacterized protein n=1 Tax=Thermoascus crustaceus TaxID=5088 RepID=UPI0037431060
MSRSPLELPEIVGHVLQYLDGKSLVAAAQVNRLWAEEATTWIWRGSYRSLESFSLPLRTLATESPKERRDWYSKKIRHLDIERADDDDNTFILPIIELLKRKRFYFPNVKSLIIDVGSENMNEMDMAHFLQPNLVCLELYGGYYSQFFLEVTRRRAPSLRSFLLSNRLLTENPLTTLLTEDDFLNFLKAMPSIKHLDLSVGWDTLLTENMMIYLMFRPGLEMLSLGRGSLLRYSTVREAMGKNPDRVPFPHLRALDVTAEDEALRLFLPLLKNLQAVDIAVVDCKFLADLPHYASSCTQLEEIDICWYGQGEFTGKSLLDLASHCPMLRRVQMEYGPSRIIDISDETVEMLAAKLVHLEVLTLPFDFDSGEISSKSLASLARHCPRLQELTMLADIEFIQLDHEPEQLHFPSLWRLSLGRIKAVRHPAELEEEKNMAAFPDRIIQLLDKRFPSLTEFNFTPIFTHDDHADPYIVKIRQHFLQRSRPFSMPWRVSSKLKERLIESVPGSRYNPFPPDV